MIRRARLILLALGLMVGWLAAPMAHAHAPAVTAVTAPCPDHHMPPCPEAPRHHPDAPACATAAGCPALTAAPPAAIAVPAAPTRVALRPPRLMLPDGIVPPPDPRPPRRA